jgi:hypothetical protein
MTRMPTPTRHWAGVPGRNGAELADQHFRKALSSRPADARILNNYGSFLFEQKRYKDAYERLSRPPPIPCILSVRGCSRTSA